MVLRPKNHRLFLYFNAHLPFMMTAKEIRQAFLDFFAARGHDIVPSAPIVVKNDPTLMFNNAGMNQFKDFFLGNKTPKNPRIADTQKCMRVSGKHNDLEDVGVDTYHHTMFEMLGNWSIGDYFKEEAIKWSWELLTDVYHLPKDRLYATVFEGDAKEGLPPAEVALREWRKLMPENHIIYGNKKDNFWEMGDSGPCGPCSEIHIDLRPDDERQAIPGEQLVNRDHPQVIEIWNNVFIQFNRKADGSLESLPAKHVDTGMGFERLVRAVQGKSSNYDTDVFMPIIERIAQITGVPYGKSEPTDIAIRVLADHIRAIVFTINDGQLPSNNGAGYVVRRILRRAVRYAFSTLQYKQPILFQLVPTVAAQFTDIFPEVQANQSFLQRVILEEENSFLRTLESGLRKVAQIEEQLKAQNSTHIDGNTAFELYDTYGFPADLTRLIAREKGLTIDETEFAVAMAAQKERARAAAKIETGDWHALNDQQSEFVGYDTLEAYTTVVKYREVAQKNKKQYQIVLAQTPFYGESGGQVGDTGTLQFGNQTIKVVDTKKENDLIVLVVEHLPDDIDQPCRACVDAYRRANIAKNHTATHLLHAALRQVLGKHVQQKGSLVAPDQLRFDISHYAKVSDQELHSVESLVNEKIMENIALEELRYTPLDEARAMGAMALFGEKYGDKVRVIVFDRQFSVELCGGTHVGATGEIGFCKIVAEEASSAGVRRIVAITGKAACELAKQESDELRHLRYLLNSPKDSAKALQDLKDQNEILRKELEKVQLERAAVAKNTLKNNAETIGNAQFIGATIAVANADILKKIAYELRNEVPNLFAVLGAICDGKPQIAVMIADSLIAEKGYDAAKLVRQAATHIQGGGGGQVHFASAGGKNPDGLDKAIATLREVLRA